MKYRITEKEKLIVSEGNKLEKVKKYQGQVTKHNLVASIFWASQYESWINITVECSEIDVVKNLIDQYHFNHASKVTSSTEYNPKNY